jgi:PAS domain S-box-containing protein
MIGARLPFISFFPALAAAGWLGIGPGIAALALSYLAADWFYIDQPFSFGILTFNVQSVTELLSFCLSGGLLVGLTNGYRQALTSAKSSAQETARRGDLLRVTLRSIGDGVITTDAHGRVVTMNPVAEALTGWTQAEATGRPLNEAFQIVNEQTRERVENPCDKVFKTGKIIGLANHTVLISKDGVERPIDDSAAPILGERGEILGAVLVFHDATQARQSFAAIETLAAIVEHSDDAIISKDVRGRITSWNAAAEKLYGYSAAEAIGQHITLIVPVERQAELDSIMQRLKRGERLEHWNTVRRRKDGTFVDVSLRISPIKNAYGEVVGASKVARDITEHKRHEESLKFLAKTSGSLATLVDQRSALQQSAESMTPFFADYCVIHILGPTGELEQQACAARDPRQRRILQRMLEEHPIDWSRPSPPGDAMKFGRTVLAPEVPDEVLIHAATNSGHLASMRKLNLQSVVCSPLQVRDRIIGVISFAMTDSGRRYSEEDVAIAEELAQRVAVAVDNAQLFASVKEADRQKDEVLAMLAHEVRNPLAAISYAVGAARMTEPAANLEMIDLIDRQVVNLSRLIDDLLDMSRISRDKILLKRESIDLAVIVRRAAAAARSIMEDKRHTLTVEVSDKPMPVYVDPTRAEQIIMNLLTNAAKYTAEGGDIELRAFPEDSEGVLVVQDSGIGISRDMLPFVFELFAQADKSLDRSQGGLGIGLTVVRKLVEMHGGSVAAHSRGIGYGSEFTVRLQLTAAAPVSESVPPLPSVNGAPKLRVLVVEDNRDTAKVEELLLRKYGHEVAVAHDGLAAIHVANNFQPHVALIDIGLPSLNGYEVASRLRQQGFDQQLLVAVSGYGQSEDRQRSRDAGFDHHLVKPVNQQELLRILGAVRLDGVATD